ncbi:hypothetical protein EVB39_090 [Rhizobium phage RHph_TM3_3_9]|nr:hypothetical protein EVB39_090 [Rhizobium phage RHph_TM3_3_9]QIG67892.1 hypothetical protein EVB53_090 [Rhizobium phage RHph_Y60]QIG68611.1 hypothetical protein EVB66_090 [Rhizobium phage RHph_TM3_3_13]QIG74469.1 hypothetical protein EVC09_089 [Rhizobium phage RHph_TM3_3_10]QXV74583.1 hypothetical protein [Rhizobium phage RHEph19]
MTSNEIKAAFAARNVKVRVKALRNGGFRICTIDGSAHGPASQSIAAELRMTNSAGILGGNINQAHEMFAYAPGVFRRV